MQNSYSIYQVREGKATRGIRFEALESLKATGAQVDRRNYDLAYSGFLEPGDRPAIQTLEALYQKFNFDHPKDFAGRSMSVSDIVVFRTDEGSTAYYADSVGFTEVPEFLDGLYHYYAYQPLDIGTFPKTEHGPLEVVPYDERTWVENSMYQVWGTITYTGPLTETQEKDYELRTMPSNPGPFRLAPRQLYYQVQEIGKYEQAHRMKDVNRMTWLFSDFGDFDVKSHVSHEKIMERYAKVEAHHDRHRGQPTIAEQLNRGGDPPSREPGRKPPRDHGDR